MDFPDYAIIVTPTIEERRELFRFLDKYGYRWGGDLESLVDHLDFDYGATSAVNIYPDQTVRHWDVRGYLSHENKNEPWWPKDEKLVLCSVQDFIEWCSEEELYITDFNGMEKLL